MLTEENKQGIVHSTKMTLQIPMLKAVALQMGPAELYERLIDPKNIPNDADCLELAQAMRENREESIKLLGATLGMM